MELCGRELASNFAWNCDFHVNSGIFYMLQICNMGPIALLPFWRKACWGFFRPEKSWRLRPGLNPRTWVLKGSTLPLDHRSRLHLLGLLSLSHTRRFWHAGSLDVRGFAARHTTRLSSHLLQYVCRWSPTGKGLISLTSPNCNMSQCDPLPTKHAYKIYLFMWCTVVCVLYNLHIKQNVIVLKP